MKKKNIIMLCAYAQSGKDTVANYLVKKYGYTKVAHADPLYEMLITMYAHLDLSIEQLWWMKINNEKLPGANSTVREMLQTLGTEWARYYVASDIWSAILVQKLTVHEANNFVISDCRFMNEYERMTKDIQFNTQVWGIDRDISIPQTHHASEKEIKQIVLLADVILGNNGLFRSLYNQIDYIIKDNL